MCPEVAAQCRDRAPGEKYCTDDVLVTCTDDLSSAETTACEGRCVADGMVARCEMPRCSDDKVQSPEQCDDGNAVSGDGCSRTCKAEVVALALGGGHTCALGGNGVVKCWGSNDQGQLGLGDRENRGDEAGELGSALRAVDLGSGRTARAIAAGRAHSCAILDDYSVKCWGGNESGQLGQGHAVQYGDEQGQMGDSLKPVDLGTGRTARSISTYFDHTCVVLDNAALKCWGANNYGQLGQGDPLPRGDSPGEMGDALRTVDLGAGRSARAVAAGRTHTCAVLDDNTVKCWGDDSANQLGLLGSSARGDGPDEMGATLATVDVGSSQPPVTVIAGHSGSCVRLSDQRMTCWGYYDPEENRWPVNIGPGGTIADAGIGWGHICTLIRNPGAILCWSDGNLLSHVVAETRVGSSTPPSPFVLSAGRTPRMLAVGGWHGCAVFDDNSLRCWGTNDSGQLGVGDTEPRPHDAESMGLTFKDVDLVF